MSCVTPFSCIARYNKITTFQSFLNIFCSEKSELIFKNHFLTILFPIDRFAEMGPSSRTFFSHNGFTCLQVLDHIHTFYQVQSLFFRNACSIIRKNYILTPVFINYIHFTFTLFNKILYNNKIFIYCILLSAPSNNMVSASIYFMLW